MELTIDLAASESRSYPLFPRVGVGAVVVHQQRLLLVRRDQPPAQGCWALPGGLVELGESLEHAVQREVQEECDLIVQPTRMLDVVEFIEPDDKRVIRYHYIIIDYLAVYVSGELRAATDVAAAQWMSADEVALLPMLELTRRFITKHQNLIWLLKESGYVE